MRLSTWTEAGLGRMDDEIAAAFAPLVRGEAAPGDRDWSREMWRQRRRILLDLLKHRFLGSQAAHQRHASSIVDEYDRVWAKGYERYQLQPIGRSKPWLWRAQRYWSNSIGATRFRQVILARIVERLRPRQVLEVGCGNGINLMLLACRFPDVQFTGLELTPVGHGAAVRFQNENATLPQAMQAYAPLPLSDPAGFRRIRFVQGSAADLPFPDGAFDLTMTVLALEQMERIRDRALSEIARVTSGHALLLEPFRDLNNRGWLLLNRIRRDYFAGRVNELPDYGLVPEFAIDDYPQEALLRTCLVLCRKSAADQRRAPATFEAPSEPRHPEDA